ncbi:DUF4123 domain-containing protein [Pantoea sp. Tr-811]|uniref:DUF4123 domain-containing protein n=1 Tax=Pantoea sp. Tr-811 TaxID=2608361 RepID=UPI00141DADBE|nr:DUF4123 domain-containing protein [Pantoea sp. Tr-811]NIF26633.1 DUF4123 domain-containing protein [Pantoea sp. Tr-811]
MDSSYVDAGWPRQRLTVVPPPAWPLPFTEHAWLLLSGDQIPSLAEDIRSLCAPGQYHWVWRGTAEEYAGPGYQAGPLLARLNEALLARFLDIWGPQQQGSLLASHQDVLALLGALKHARHLRASDGNTLVFQWSRLRKLEELCEALPHQQLLQLLSPLQRLIWHSGLGRDSWLQLTLDDSSPLPLPQATILNLTQTDESALNSAGHAWFLRHACHAMEHHLKAMDVPFDPLDLRRQLADFDREAGYCGFHLEGERRYYMQLRLLFPEQPFVKDRPLYNLLLDTGTQGQQRLMDINDRLLAISSPITTRDQQ